MEQNSQQQWQGSERRHSQGAWQGEERRRRPQNAPVQEPSPDDGTRPPSTQDLKDQTDIH
jgi:hypothetical protein